MKPLIIVGTPAGGAGKSTLSLRLAEAIAPRVKRLAVLDADIGPEEGKTKVRLDAVLAGRPNVAVALLGTGPSDDDMRRDKNSAVRHWSQVREVAGSVDATILDLGANVLQKFGEHMAAAAELYEDEGIAVTLIVPVSARGGCLGKAIEGMKLWAEAVPNAAVVIVANEVAGPVKNLPDYAKLKAIVPEASELTLPACLALGTDAWARLEAVPMSPSTAEAMPTRDLVAALNRAGGRDLLAEEAAALKLDIKKWWKALAAAGFNQLVDGLLPGNAERPAA